MKNTIQTTLTTEMQQESIPKTCQVLSSSLEDFLVKLSALLENEKDLTKQEEHYFLRLQGFSETKNPLVFYSKTLRAYYLMIGAELSKPFLGSAMNSGMMYHGRFIIPKIMVCRIIGRGFLLRDILEPVVEDKYYLSPELTRRLMSQ